MTKFSLISVTQARLGHGHLGHWYKQQQEYQHISISVGDLIFWREWRLLRQDVG